MQFNADLWMSGGGERLDWRGGEGFWHVGRTIRRDDDVTLLDVGSANERQSNNECNGTLTVGCRNTFDNRRRCESRPPTAVNEKSTKDKRIVA